MPFSGNVRRAALIQTTVDTLRNRFTETSARWLRVRAASMIVMLAAAEICAPAQDALPGTLPEPSETAEPTAAQGHREDSPEIRVRSNLVVTPVTVVNSSGEFVFELAQSDFEILDNGVAQRIEGYESEPRRMAVVIVVQTSRSIEALLKDIHRLGPVFSSLLLGPEGEAAVITYGDRVNLAQDFSADGDQLETTLGKIGPEGVHARLNDALMRAVALFERRSKTERRLIIAFSTGFDEASESTSEDILRRATGAEVAIYGLGFNPVKGLLTRRPRLSAPGPIDTNVARPIPPGGARTPSASVNVSDANIPVVDILDATGQVIRSAVAKNPMEYYAGYTGGVFYSKWKKDSLDDHLSRIAAEVHSQYELAYIPDTLAQPGFHTIQVRVRRDGLKVRARAGYFYQAPAAPEKPAAPAAAGGPGRD